MKLSTKRFEITSIFRFSLGNAALNVGVFIKKLFLSPLGPHIAVLNDCSMADARGLSCSVCYNNFKSDEVLYVPRNLICGHTYCTGNYFRHFCSLLKFIALILGSAFLSLHLEWREFGENFNVNGYLFAALRSLRNKTQLIYRR